MNSGIYQILNTANGNVYIGSSQNLKRRLKDHKVYLRINKSPSTHLQSAFNKYGEDAFEFSVIEYCEIDRLTDREQFWLDTIPVEKRYNQRPIVESNRGYKFSEEAKEKLKKRNVWNKGTKGKGICIATAGCIKEGQHISVETEFKKGMLTWNKGTKGVCKPNKTSYKPRPFEIVSPNNVLYTGVNLFRFSKEMGVEYSALQKVVFYKTKDEYRGWRLPKENDVYDGIGLWLDAA